MDPIGHWPDVTEGDFKNFKYGAFYGIDLITGGPPCQPFSKDGKHGLFLDERDMFPQAIHWVFRMNVTSDSGIVTSHSI